METTVLDKEDVIEMLGKINSQLEQLDRSIEYHMSRQQQLWEANQETKLNTCMRQLEILENKITSTQERKEIHATSLKMKLSY